MPSFLGQLGELKTHACLTPEVLTRGLVTLPVRYCIGSSIEPNTPNLGAYLADLSVAFDANGR